MFAKFIQNIELPLWPDVFQSTNKTIQKQQHIDGNKSWLFEHTCKQLLFQTVVWKSSAILKIVLLENNDTPSGRHIFCEG